MFMLTSVHVDATSHMQRLPDYARKIEYYAFGRHP